MPQLVQPLPQLLQQLLQLLQQLDLQHDFLQANRPLSKPPQHFFLQQLLQQLLQAGCSQQVGSAAQQEASQQLPQAGASQQVGSAAQHEASQQVGSQQLFLQQLWQANKPFRSPNRQHFFLQQLLQLLQAGCSQQVGSAAQQEASHDDAQQAGCSQQVGSAAQQEASQHDEAQHEGSQQLLHPPPPP